MTALADYRHPPHIRAVLGGLARVVCPPEAEKLDVIDDIVDHVELSMRALPPVIRAGLVAGLTTYDLAAVPLRGRRSHKLAAEDAVGYFESWRSSKLTLRRELARGVRGLLCLAHYEMPAVQERMGYTPQAWIDKVSKRRLQVYSEDIRRHEQSITEPDPLVPGAGTKAEAY